MKNNFKILIALALVVCTLSFVSCKDKKDPPGPEIPEGGFEGGDESEGPIVDIPGFES